MGGAGSRGCFSGYRVATERLWRRTLRRTNPYSRLGSRTSAETWNIGGSIIAKLPNLARGGPRERLGICSSPPGRNRKADRRKRGCLNLAKLYANENFPFPVV